MAKFLRYMGEFLSRAGVVWRVEILQDADAPFNPVGSLDFEADEALVIEWGHTEKKEVICGSTATLRLESPGDRTYEDLYTIAPGRIRMDVYRDNLLYWSGALDPEFYEEPYEKAANYPVTLIFSDFGVLDRLKYDLSGMRSLYEIVGNCVSRTMINSIIDESLISTSLTAGGGQMSLSDLKVRSDNFYDEDGEALTLKEVLEGVLQPLALRVVQRAGRVYVYDLNALYHTATKPVIWDGDSQTMGTDRVFNNAKITWSTYAQSGELLLTDCYTDEVSESETALDTLAGRTVGDARIYTYPSTTEVPINPDDFGFTIWLNDTGEYAEIIDNDVKFYKIVPHYDGSESVGIALCWPAVAYSSTGRRLIWNSNGIPKEKLRVKQFPPQTGPIIFRGGRVSIPKINGEHKHGLRISIEMLMDCRFNPFESVFVNWEPGQRANGQNHEQFVNLWNTYGNIVYVPVTIQYRDYGTGDLYVWTNRRYVTESGNVQVPYIAKTYGEWVKNTGTEITPSDFGYLAFYNTENRGEGAGAGVIGWSKNRPAIPPTIGKLGINIAKAKDGQYIPYPNFGKEGGEVWLEVRNDGWSISHINPWGPFNKDKFQESVNDPQNFFRHTKFNWLLLKLPQIEILNINELTLPINSDDVEYSAEINEYAKEDIPIDTICGSSKEGVPLARGAYFSAQNGEQITELTRAGRTTQIEELLIGTLFSQFGERRTKLSGEMQLADSGLCSYTEDNQDGKKFILTGDMQDVITDTSNATLIELRPDEYERREA